MNPYERFFPRSVGEILPFLKQSPAFYGMSVHAFGMALALLQAILLARNTEPDVYGAYTVGMSVATLLSVVACIGLCQLAVREIPKEQVKGSEGNPIGFIRLSRKILIYA